MAEYGRNFAAYRNDDFPYMSTRLVKSNDRFFGSNKPPETSNTILVPNSVYLNFNGNLNDNGLLMNGAPWSVGGHAPYWYYYEVLKFHNTPWEYSIYLDQDVFLYSSVDLSKILRNHYCLDFEIIPVDCINDQVPEIFLFRSMYFDMTLSIITVNQGQKGILHFVQFKFKDGKGVYQTVVNDELNIVNNKAYHIAVQTTSIGSPSGHVELIVNQSVSKDTDYAILTNITTYSDFMDTVDYTCAIGRDILPNGDPPPRYSNFKGYINSIDLTRGVKWKIKEVNNFGIEYQIYPYDKAFSYYVAPLYPFFVQFPLKSLDAKNGGYLNVLNNGWDPYSYMTLETRDAEHYGDFVSLGYDEYSIFNFNASSTFDNPLSNISYLEESRIMTNDDDVFSKKYNIGVREGLFLKTSFRTFGGGTVSFSINGLKVYRSYSGSGTDYYYYLKDDSISGLGKQLALANTYNDAPLYVTIEIKIDSANTTATVKVNNSFNTKSGTDSITTVNTTRYFTDPTDTVTITLSGLKDRTLGGTSGGGGYEGSSYIDIFKIDVDGTNQQYNPHYPPPTIIPDGGDDSIKANPTDTDTTKFDASVEDLDIMMVHIAHRGDLEEAKLNDSGNS